MLESLNCNSCGAPLEVPASANFIKCNHCGCQLAVRRSQSATFTEVVERLSTRTAELSEQVEQLTRQNKLAKLDRRWEEERETYMVSGRYGRRYLPDEGSSLLGGIMLTVFGCIWIAMAIGVTSSAPNFGPFAIARIAFPAFGVLFVLFGIGMSIRNFSKAQDYRRAKQRFQAERERMESENR